MYIIGQICHWSVCFKVAILGLISGQGMWQLSWKKAMKKSYDKQLLTKTWTFTIDRRGNFLMQSWIILTLLALCWSLRFGECPKKRAWYIFSFKPCHFYPELYIYSLSQHFLTLRFKDVFENHLNKICGRIWALYWHGFSLLWFDMLGSGLGHSMIWSCGSFLSLSKYFDSWLNPNETCNL